ncbi:MAG: SH3 domain-containing protein [Caldilinea sp. CFX5]|nr:SH3 domain-containing protein [Caldilinea sp. CFX5]
MKTYTLSVTKLLVGATTTLVMVCLFCSSALAQAATTGTVNRNANLRAGPGTTFAVVGGASAGQTVTIVATNTTGDWYQLETGEWIAAFLVDGVNAVPTRMTPPDPTTPPSAQPTIAATPLPAQQTTTANRNANLRAGPGTTYAVIGAVQAGQMLKLAGRNADESWYQLANGPWIAAFLVGGAPAPPPTPPTVAATATPASPSSGNQYVLVQKRLLDPYENGGSLDGPSVHCGLSRRLIVNVLDANGNRVNGVAVQVLYGAREIIVTGSQGRGDGVAEFVLGGGQDVTVVRDANGQPVTSDVATNLSTNPANIPFDILQRAQYCQDEESCRRFAESNSCNGHFSWNVTFQRR